MRRFSSRIYYLYLTGTVTVVSGRLVACPKPASVAQSITLWLRRRDVSPVALGLLNIQCDRRLSANVVPYTAILVQYRDIYSTRLGQADHYALRENHISSQFNEPKRNPPAADGFGQTEAQTTFQKTDRSEWLRVSPEKTVSAGGNRRGKAGCGSGAPTSPQAGTASGVIDV